MTTGSLTEDMCFCGHLDWVHGSAGDGPCEGSTVIGLDGLILEGGQLMTCPCTAFGAGNPDWRLRSVPMRTLLAERQRSLLAAVANVLAFWLNPDGTINHELDCFCLHEGGDRPVHEPDCYLVQFKQAAADAGVETILG